MTDERPTPETDELSQSIITHNNTYACYEQMKMHARCLERERDEARELIDDIWITATSDHRFIMPPSKKQIPQHIEGIIKAYDKAHDDWTPEEIKTLMRERDEAKKEIKNIKKLLLDPNAVHINMLHGQIAKLDWEKLEHIHGNHPAREQLATERALVDRLGDALNQCKDGYEELLEDRAWWAEEPRCGYQKRYLEMVKNKEQTNKVLTAWKEARSE